MLQELTRDYANLKQKVDWVRRKRDLHLKEQGFLTDFFLLFLKVLAVAFLYVMEELELEGDHSELQAALRELFDKPSHLTNFASQLSLMLNDWDVLGVACAKCTKKAKDVGLKKYYKELKGKERCPECTSGRTREVADSNQEDKDEGTHWTTTWRAFTRIVEEAAEDVAKLIPKSEEGMRAMLQGRPQSAVRKYCFQSCSVFS